MKGIYILVISIKEPIIITVGSLGSLKFNGGLYAYVGSAQNNLKKRVLRHLSRSKRVFWHIDYLLNSEKAEILKVFYKNAPKEYECKMAKAIMSFGEPVIKFGSSDCKCKAHLIKLKGYEGLKKLIKAEGFRRLKLNANTV